jgi:hypothetical protein
MGFLDNTTITVDAILTKKGRRRLSQGAFKITKFALSDEEIDYNLYDITHPNGTDSYGTVIENMNLMEAIPNRTSFMSYLVNDSVGGATLKIDTDPYTVDWGTPITITPETVGAPTEKYVWEIENRNIIRFKSANSATKITAKSATVIAQVFGAPLPNATTILTVTGENSGLPARISITVNTKIGADGNAYGPDDDDDDDGGGGGGGGGDPGCFIAGTKIQLPNGIKYIEDIEVGDMVKSFDVGTSSVVNSKVTETFAHSDRYYMILNGNIKTTSVHPFYSDGNWIEAGDLSIGDKILHVDGLEHTIETIELSDESVTVYNFEVDGTHNYFAEGYLVHNKAG